MYKTITKEEGCIEADQKCETVEKFAREIRVNYRGKKMERLVLRDSQMAATALRKVLPDNSREHVVSLYLDGAHQIIGYAVVFTGTANSCVIHPREIFQRAFLCGAVAILIGHNHPSGNPEPSDEDQKLTKQLHESSNVVGIKLLDHIVIGEGRHYSFAENFNVL